MRRQIPLYLYYLQAYSLQANANTEATKSFRRKYLSERFPDTVLGVFWVYF